MKNYPIAIMEPNWGGHRLWYASLLLAEFRDKYAVLFTTNQAVRSEEWRVHLSECTALIQTATGENSCRRAALKWWIRSNGFLIILDGDRILVHVLAAATAKILTGKRPRGALVLMRLNPTHGFDYRFWTKLLAVATMRVLAPDIRCFGLQATRAGLSPIAERAGVRWLADPTCLSPQLIHKETWLSANMIPPSHRVFLVIGDLSERKNIPAIISAWRRSPPPDSVLLLVGRPSARVREICDTKPSPQIRLIEGYVSDQVFDTWISVADAVYILHSNEGSSGVLLKCAAVGTPALVGGASSLITAAKELGLAAIVTELNPSSIAAATHMAANGKLPRGSARCVSSIQDFTSSLLLPGKP
ncbi:glycosyltransferase [Frankia sp. Cr2]|uniref:glycosyltransferase n=1 Tax=Frankia sp. Cr2 TaxID=3073932 RepID=UPI002AD56A5E|nr:glycosyltransferase [Frankia sp. Cr2]